MGNGAKILIINGSPRSDSNTMVMANKAKDVIEQIGGLVNIEHLAEKNIKNCLGCWSDNNDSCTYPCIIKDDLAEVFENIIASDGIIFVSGVYWFGITGLLKTMIDRLTCMWKNGADKPLLDNKVAVFMSSSAEEGNVMAMAPLLVTTTFLGMHILPYGLIYGDVRNKSDFKNGWGLEFAERCGRNMVAMISLLKKKKIDWWNEEKS